MKEGLYYPSGDFLSDDEIKKKLAMRDLTYPKFETPIDKPKDFDYWSQRFEERAKIWKETSAVEHDHVKISFKGDTILNFIGDTHIGSPVAHYDRLRKELLTIVGTPNSYVILAGDLVDGFFFNEAQMEQAEQPPEQFEYMKAIVKFLAEKKRLLMGFSGDHDGWVRKMGIDPYKQFAELHAYYIQGVGYLTAKVDEIEYRIAGAHQLPGFSMYNNTHPQMRASKEIQGADIYFSGHTHQKGHSEQATKEFGGHSRPTHFISVGPYKPTDDYARKKGFPQLDNDQMYGCAVILSGKNKHVSYFGDILEANK